MSPSPTVAKTAPNPASSPIMTRPENGMDFFEAFRAIADAKSVTRLEWKDPNCYCRLVNGKVCIHKSDTDLFHPWIINDGDMDGEDWVVI